MAPDGYTLLLGNTGEISINKYLIKDTAAPLVSLVPIGITYSITHDIAVPGNSPYRTLDDMLADARARPDKVRFASTGVGTPGHLAGESLAIKSKARSGHSPSRR
jgi:tripartite-type tricarboxylate transporter receptor subunit TctC